MSTATRSHPLLDSLLQRTLEEYPAAADLLQVGDVEGAQDVLNKEAEALRTEGTRATTKAQSLYNVASLLGKHDLP